jgi:hypothetical protein
MTGSLYHIGKRKVPSQVFSCIEPYSVFGMLDFHSGAGYVYENETVSIRKSFIPFGSVNPHREFIPLPCRFSPDRENSACII